MEKAFVRRVKGRFIKKDDPIRDSVSITDFNLLDICETEITYADNVDANIIHTRLHLEKSINDGVKISNEINSVFEPTEYRPVIKPLDFTQEWIKQKKRMHSRHSRIDEEDEVDVEMENIAKKLKSKFGKKKIGKSKEKASDIIDANVDLGISETGQDPLEQTTDESAQSDSYKIVGDAINQISDQKDSFSSLNISENKVTPSERQGDDMSLHQRKNGELSQIPVSREDEFIPMHNDDVAPRVSEEELNHIREEAASVGFEEGYRHGEEKATLVNQEKISEISQGISDAIEQMGRMKQAVLKNVQGNFEVLCKSMIESMLQKEFSLNPDSFREFISRAVSEAVPDDSFKVLVGQEAYDSLKDLMEENVIKDFKVDDSIKGYDFKIESNLTVVDGNIHQIIEDLLKNADLNIFDQNKA